VVPDVDFKHCCLESGKYDDANRNYFFPCEVSLALDFRLLFAKIVTGETGNGGRLHCPLGSPESFAVVFCIAKRILARWHRSNRPASLLQSASSMRWY
jgi:hypothetical protein